MQKWEHNIKVNNTWRYVTCLTYRKFTYILRMCACWDINENEKDKTTNSKIQNFEKQKKDGLQIWWTATFPQNLG